MEGASATALAELDSEREPEVSTLQFAFSSTHGLRIYFVAPLSCDTMEPAFSLHGYMSSCGEFLPITPAVLVDIAIDGRCSQQNVLA